MTHELVERLRDEADLCSNDGATDIAKLLHEAACAVDYFSAHHFKRMPAWLPCRIKLAEPLHGDFPIGHDTTAEAGEHDCYSNGWRRNEKA